MLPPPDAFWSELQVQTSRSSGPGGQNVNKVESRVELRFDVAHSQLLTDEQKQRILEKLGPQLTADGLLLVTAQEDRSQLRNKELALLKLHDTLAKALHRPKPRKPTKPSKGAVRKRLDSKKRLGEKKANRRPGLDL
ncbi:aminoacyl-tRNA hydrolase [Hymenobacter busanensis]|uniref:Aminoacyl-tRNA hydrolase n=1 Tax=Hymenobacter busanensis TaxID=2607656 RepID=A0A7L5A3R2_9BACT|nr:alternative ribosome rescue aminoacyl-tRNA hydrolase ArfB [Hymenobacter busanensis]KAA9331416.1 aminoacyl-tRNA hydrolase [Hymenobacter busanensis]QHJ08570.1 aminoacyl-tRNA hydrolase [Hymenobacter busanensis]